MYIKKTFFFVLLLSSILFSSEHGGIDLDINGTPSAIARSLELRGNGLIPEERPYTKDFLEDYLSKAQDSLEFALQFVDWTQSRLELLPDTNREIVAVFNPGMWGFSNSENTEFYFKGLFGLQMSHDDFNLVGIYDVDLGYLDDPNYYGKKWEGKSGRLDRGYLSYTKPNWDVLIGKTHNGWGSGLLMSDSSYSFEQIRYRLSLWKNLRISFIAGFLDKDNVNALTPWREDVPIINRYLSTRKIEYHNNWLSLYIIESVIYGGENRILEPYYLVPLTWIHAEQLNHGINDNTFIGGGFKVVYSPLRFRGELIIDDYQIDDEVQGDQEPNQIAFYLSAEYGTTLKDKMLDFELSYEGSRNRTYSQEISRNMFTFEGRCEGGLFDEWTTPWLDPENPDSLFDYNEPFPTGTVEGKTTIFIGSKGNFFKNINYSLTAEYWLYSNFQNVKGQKDEDFQLSFELTWDFKYPFKNGLSH